MKGEKRMSQKYEGLNHWAQVTGDTRQHAEALKKHGYRWDPKQGWWWREIAADRVGPMAAQTTHPFSSCRRVIISGGAMISDIDLRAETDHVGNCAACGSYGPLHRTPNGWVCSDCH
jgi:hypothetical protein